MRTADIISILVVAAIAGAVTALAFLGRRKGVALPDTIVVQYEPPTGLAPAEAGTLIDGRVHDRDILATILDLTVRGHLAIADAGEDFEFTERADAPAEGLKEFEKLVKRTLFSGRMEPGAPVRLSDASRARAFVHVMDDLRHMLSKDLTAAGYFAARPDVARSTRVAIGVLILIPASLLALLFYTLFTGKTLPGLAYLIALVPGVAVAAASSLAVSYTAKGAAAAAHAMGFRLYLSQAEKYRLEWQEKEMMFEKYLPYAAAFDVVDAWTDAFAGMAAPPPTELAALRGVDRRRYRDLSREFQGALAAAREAIAQERQRRLMREARRERSRRHSGFGRHGRSGGGFGGGGGGSW